MNVATVVVLSLMVVAFVFAVRRCFKRGSGCGCGCSGCAGCSRHAEQVKKLPAEKRRS